MIVSCCVTRASKEVIACPFAIVPERSSLSNELSIASLTYDDIYSRVISPPLNEVATYNSWKF